jgi:hypothetical protein
MSSGGSNTQGGTTGGRGPAPPLPEKPPSVAERTRLLKSSFRRDEVEKPKVLEKHNSPIAERAATVPPANVINASTNGEKSETPSPASSVNSMSSVGRYNGDKVDSNKEASQNYNVAGVSIHRWTCISECGYTCVQVGAVLPIIIDTTLVCQLLSVMGFNGT